MIILSLKRIINDGIFRRQYASYLIGFIVIISILGYVIFSIAYSTIKDQSEIVYIKMLEEVKKNIDTKFEDIYNLNLNLFSTSWFKKIMFMKSLADEERISYYEFLRSYEELSNYESMNSFIEEFFIYFRNSQTIISSRGKDEPELFFKTAFNIKNSNSERIYSLLNKSSYSEIIPDIKIKWYSDNYNAIVYINSPYSKYAVSTAAIIRKDKLDDILLDFNENSFIIDKDNNIVAGDRDNITTRELMNYNLFSENKGVIYKRIKNKKYIISYCSSKTNNWKYVSIVPIKDILGNALRFKNIFIYMFLISVIGMLFINIIITRKTLAPVQKIIFDINKYSNKKFDQKINYELIENFFNNLISEKSILVNEINKHKPIVENYLLQRLIKREFIDEDEMIRELNKHGINFRGRTYCTALFEIENKGTKNGTNTTEILVIIIKTLHSFLSGTGIDGQAFEYSEDKVVLIINTSNDNFIEHESGLNNILKNIKMRVECTYEVSVTIAVGKMCQSLKGIKDSFEEAKKALKYKLILGNSKVIMYSNIEGKGEGLYYYPMNIEAKLIENIKMGEYKIVESIIDDIVGKNLNIKNLNYETAKFLFYNFAATALKAIEKINLDKHIKKDILIELSNLSTFDEMIGYIKNFYKEICCLMNENMKLVEDKQITDIMKDIEENYRNSNISLESISDKYNTSKSTISRFFKKRTGLYFSDYLNMIRIKKAKILLESTDMLIKDIALEVGYINDITFRRIFKKYVMITPTEYRK